MNQTPNELTVLLVEPCWDEAAQLKGYLRRIKEFDASINHVRDHENALKSVEHTIPDVILLEHDLNEETALPLAREIRVNNYNLPIVVLTDEGDEQICAKYFRIGVDDYRTKDQLNPDLLHAAIKYGITQRKNKIERKRAAKFDELTNLYNRRFTFKRLHEEMTSAVRHNHSFSLCLIDLDGFKEINDRLGHLSGDYLLKRVSELIKDSVRTDDIVGRYGGDEFLIGLRNTSSAGAYRAAQKLTDEVGQTVFNPPASEQVQVDCSIGVAEFQGDRYDHADEIETVEEFIDRADQALYNAKEEGQGSVERRRHPRHVLDDPISVSLSSDRDQSSVHVVEISRSGVRLEDSPQLKRGKEITLVFNSKNGRRVEKQGTIRSCQADDHSTLATLGVEVDLPRDLLNELTASGEDSP